MARLTVGIPVFNAMPYLPESLDSILGQTYGDFEILVVNDGSTDDSREYLEAIRDPRLRIVNQPNQGITAALNRMLSEARTPWLVRHDADDVAYPQRIARTVEFIDRYPESGMFYSLAEYYPKGSVAQFRTTKGSPEEIRKLVLAGYLPAICHPSVTLNVERARSAGGYRFNLHVEDIDLWWRLALDQEVRFIPEVLVGFRQNLQSVSSANLEVQAINTLYVQYLLLSHLWSFAPLPYEQACLALGHLFDRRRLAFKTQIRAFNMTLGKRQRLRALYHLSRAMSTSPRDFSRRFLDEVLHRRKIGLGESPSSFLEYKDVLWPVRMAPRQNAVSSEATASLELSAARPVARS